MKSRRHRTGQTRADLGCDGLSPGDASILGGAVEQQGLLVHVSNVENTPGRTDTFERVGKHELADIDSRFLDFLVCL